MKIQVLIATMKQKDYSLLRKMNIQTDVIVGNQCNYNAIEKFEFNNHSAMYLNFDEHGVGLNRNNTLMRASGDICLFADDDMIYVDGYEKIVKQSFEKYSDADVIVFNLNEKETTRYIIKKVEKVGYLNYLRYGTARIAIRLDSVKRNGIFFNQCFGGGTEHCHGEDNLFLTDCLRKGLKIYALPVTIAILTEDRKSTWNIGYNKKYFLDQGALYYAISKRWWKMLCLQDAIRRRKVYKISWMRAYNLMKNGVK